MSTYRSANEDIDQSSDEKMDTGSESYRSQGTPSSILSLDCEDRSPEGILRLRNPESDIEGSTEPETNANVKVQKELADSFVSKMSNLHLDSPLRPKLLGISPPKFSSSLVHTTNHPLMNLGSPDDYPDLIPKSKPTKEEDRTSHSSVEDVRVSETNGYGIYSPEINTSKNNLYFSEMFSTAESQIDIEQNQNSCPDVAKVEQKERRKIVAKLMDKKEMDATATPPRVSQFNDSAIRSDFENMRMSHKSTPKGIAVAMPDAQYRCEVAEWCESPSHLRSLPNFELPIELSANITRNHQDLDSPDVVSSSTQEDKSAYQALLDPYTGSVALKHTAARSPNTQRRRIQLPPEEDRRSLDSLSVSLDSDDELPAPEVEPRGPAEEPRNDDEVHSPTKSSKTPSECSDTIPEYSAAEEFNDERSWLTVRSGETIATCDMKVIEPFKRVISHGGYDGGGAAIVVFSACHLPDTARPDYSYVMDHLFLYVIWTLERLVVDEYVVVYLHGSASRRRLPSCRWLHECYKLLDRRLRKSLKHLYLVHPTFWVKSFVLLAKTFVSSKFFRKLSYVSSIRELFSLVPVEPNAIPEPVKQFDSSGGR